MERFRIIAFTHRTTDLKEIGRLHIATEERAERLGAMRSLSGIDELMYLSTCNRVEFVMSSERPLNDAHLRNFFASLMPDWNDSDLDWAMAHAQVYEGREALQHLFFVASSIDSLVVGEREIITQVREAYEQCRSLGLTGDALRLLIRATIETAKKVYTDTQIAQNPVSVVSLAHREMLTIPVGPRPRVVMVGAGVTNRSMAEYLIKDGPMEITVYNRTLARAEELASHIGGSARSLSELGTHTGGFEILIACTGAADPVIGKELLQQLIAQSPGPKVVVDLALPSDLGPGAADLPGITYIGLSELKEQARRNLEQRQREIERCKTLIRDSIAEFEVQLRERDVELALREVPQLVHEIGQKALNEVFAKDLNTLDPHAREVLNKVVAYLEKKYIALPMKKAKEVMLHGHTLA
jgi:glutamyl-tRNA reductase